MGEDIGRHERGVIQREQVRSWLEQQIKERQEAEISRIKAEQEYSAALVARDQRAIDLEHMEDSCRHKMQKVN